MGTRRRRQQTSAAPGACRITFASISALQPASGPSDSDVRHAQQLLVHHAQRLLSGLRLDAGGSAGRNGGRGAPLAWLRLSGSRNLGSDADCINTGRDQQQPRRRFPLPAQQRQEQEKRDQQPGAAPPGLLANLCKSGGGVGGGGGGQMLVAAATTAATTLIAAASSSLPGTKQQQQQEQRPDDAASGSGVVQRNSLRHRRRGEGPRDDSAADVVCVETLGGGRRRVYRLRSGVENGQQWHGFDMVEDEQTHQGRLKELVRSYLLPQGFPDSVAPQYAQYMAWRGVQYFFGGAISVFTTKCLLGALGVAGRHSGEAAAAINWVLKDGAGRLGRFLFARWGRELDCELKQFRLAGDILMEAGAALELSTILAPDLFLPLACTANLAKNLAAVANSSTRAPIYRTFALQNNLADITAKGESVANLADILGTLAGIALSKGRLPMVPTFMVLSAGYLIASRKEVDSVELPYLNRARLAYTSAQFVAGGAVPGVREANKKEPLLPWGRYHQGRVVLGAPVEDAVQSPSELARAAALHRSERFMITYRHDSKKVYVILREGAQTADTLKAAFCAHMVLHLMEQCPGHPPPNPASKLREAISSTAAGGKAAGAAAPGAAAAGAAAGGKAGAAAGACAAGAPAGPAALEPWRRLVAAGQAAPGEGRADQVQRLMEASKPVLDGLYTEFNRQAERQGWKLHATMLNPRETRLMRVQPMAL